MNKSINIYQTLNERKRYILKQLEVYEKDLKPEYYSYVIGIMKNMTNRISELPLSREQVISAINDFNQFHALYFKGLEFIKDDRDYPNVKINVYESLSSETKDTLRLLNINIEDKELTAKEYAELSNILVNKILIKYGTGIKKQECIDLTVKLVFFFLYNKMLDEE